MKKILLAVLIVFSLNSLYSQDLTYGVDLGTSVSTIFELNPINKGQATAPEGIGIYFGGFVNYKIGNKIGVFGSIAYDNRESNFSVNPNNSLIINHNYLTINPSVKFSLSETYNTGFYLRPGVKYSLFLSASDKESQFEIIKNFNGLFAANIAFGYDLNNYLGIELYFDYSLNDILNDSPTKLLTGMFRVNINLESILNK